MRNAPLLVLAVMTRPAGLHRTARLRLTARGGAGGGSPTWCLDRQGQHHAGFRQRIRIVSHHLESPEPGQRAPGSVSADAAQRHQRAADASDRRPPGCRRRQRRVRRRSAHVRISRRVERHRLVDLGQETFAPRDGEWQGRAPFALLSRSVAKCSKNDHPGYNHCPQKRS